MNKRKAYDKQNESIQADKVQIGKIAHKFSAMVGEVFEYQYSDISKIALKFSTMVVEVSNMSTLK